jgi:LacI family transcriptional regulator
MEKPRARLKDVAQATGFSVNTVSLALRSSRRIPQATSAVIVEAARRLDYVPNRAARSLVSHSSGAVGVVLTDFGNPSQAAAARVIERRLSEVGYSMILAESDHSVDNEIAAVEALRSHQVDGLLIYPADHGRIAHLRRWRAAGQSIVLLCASRHAGVDVAAVDDRLGAAQATAHLAALGHRRIAFFDSGAPLGSREKFDGYLDALLSHSIALDVALALDPRGQGAREGYEAMARLMALTPEPTALFAPTDALALGALAWCREHGVGVPQNFAVVGYGNVESSAFVSPPLTSVSCDIDAVGAAAIGRLLAVAEASSRKTQVTLIKPQLVVRASCGGRGA